MWMVFCSSVSTTISTVHFALSVQLFTSINKPLFLSITLKMPHTLVTGANSFVAAHILSKLIAEGHTVTGSVRRASAGAAILAENPAWKEKLDFIEITDYATPGIWDDVFKTQSFDYIVHVAAPLLDNPANTDYDRDYLRPSVEG